MKLKDVTPKYNSLLVEEVGKRFPEAYKSKSEFNRCFDKVLVERGFNPDSYHKYMRKYF